MDKQLYTELNKQIQEEFYAAFLYLSMANWLEDNNFGGFGQWMKAQFEEEQGHAMKLRRYLLDVGMKVELLPIGEVPTEFDSPLACFKAALAHEKHVTARFNMMFEMAREKKDYATELALQWFITEQVEEEKETGDAVAQLEIAAGSVGALMQLNAIYGKRD